MRIPLRTRAALLMAGPAVALLVGCGSGDTEAEPVDQKSSESSESSEETGAPTPTETVPPGPVEFTAIALISASNAEGTVSPRAVVLDSRKDVDEFAGGFSGAQMSRAVAREYARADLPDGEVLLAAVVDVSCQAPSGVQVEKTRRGIEVTAVAEKSKVEVQCLVPVTTVALVSVPESAV